MLEPYYDRDGITLYLGDCREILPQIDVKVDLVLTDPPYGINLDLTWLSDIHIAKHSPTNKIDVPIEGDDGMMLDFLWQFPNRVIWGHPYIYDAKATGWLVWDKQPGIDTDRTLSSPVEIASSTTWKGFKLIRNMWAGYMREDGEKRYAHPTQKPIKLFTYIIRKSKSNIVLDPFLGSGTTTVACKILGRRCIGIEIEEKYLKIAIERLRQSVMRLE